MSFDGRSVVFESGSSDLTRGDTNDRPDVFVADSVCCAGGTAIRVRRHGAPRDVAVEDPAVGDVAVTASGRKRPIR